MADRRCHRGAHPEDRELFADAQVAGLRSATADLSWLLSRGYAQPSALKVVGDRYGLTVRQRVAVMRSACSDEALRQRTAKRVEASALAGERVWIDGYNLLTTVEAALAGGVLLVGRDGACRDMASMHGTWRRVEETEPAIEIVGKAMEELHIAEAVWLVDRPVSNSGRLKAALESASRGRWNWRVELVMNPDVPLAAQEEIVVTADSVILDRCRRWSSLARWCVERRAPGAWVVDLEAAS